MGILMLREVIFSGVNLFNNILAGNSGYYRFGFLSLWPSALAFVIYCVIFFMLLFKTSVVIDKLRLDQDFYNEQFALEMDSVVVLRTGIMAAGIYLLVDSAPSLCKDIIAYYQAYTSNIFAETKNYNAQGIGYSGTKLVAAYLLLANHNYIAHYLSNREKAEE